mmetsp:Transcript_85335/g.241861  ORF Transcript_85335/g.241861 Transcript_85335/m.241861 type:complete len:264 (-) Transcript_85335:2388-3179(-)
MQGGPLFHNRVTQVATTAAPPCQSTEPPGLAARPPSPAPDSRTPDCAWTAPLASDRRLGTAPCRRPAAREPPPAHPRARAAPPASAPRVWPAPLARSPARLPSEPPCRWEETVPRPRPGPRPAGPGLGATRGALAQQPSPGRARHPKSCCAFHPAEPPQRWSRSRLSPAGRGCRVPASPSQTSSRSGRPSSHGLSTLLRSAAHAVRHCSDCRLPPHLHGALRSALRRRSEEQQRPAPRQVCRFQPCRPSLLHGCPQVRLQPSQ